KRPDSTSASSTGGGACPCTPAGAPGCGGGGSRRGGPSRWGGEASGATAAPRTPARAPRSWPRGGGAAVARGPAAGRGVGAAECRTTGRWMARLASQAAAGFFPTPPRVVAALCRHLAAPGHGSKRVVRVLDPCAGTGEPAAALARALGAESYGIELNEERAAQ